MKPLLLILSFILLTITSTFAQTERQLSGTIVDSTKLSLPGSSIKMTSNLGDSLMTIADVNGKFALPVKGTKITLTISSIGFQSIIKHYSLDADTKPVDVGNIIMPTQTNMLGVVTIVGTSPVTLKEDTVEYKVSSYPVRENAPVEDVLKKLPGVDVDKDGNVTAQGKSVTKVRVNGKDFFGGDVKTATKNLPADVVESIQIIDDYGDQANLTGVKTGEPDKILNITIRKDKNYGYFGQATSGDGSDLLPKVDGVDVHNDNRYVGLLNAFNFKGDQQIAVLGSLNNTNVNTFSFNSSTGGTGGGGGFGGGGGGFGGGGGGRGNALRGTSTNGSTTPTNGITNARSIGANFRDQWGKAVSVYGSYSFSDNTVNTISQSIQTNNLSTPSVSTQNSNQKDNPVNHRFNFNVEFKPDTINYLKVTPTFNYSSTNTNSVDDVTSTRGGVTNLAYNSISHSDGTSPSGGVNALYNHRFNSHGRNLSINFSINTSKNSQFDNPQYTYTVGVPTAPINQVIFTDSRTTTFGTTLSYLEPLSKLSFLEFNYAYSHSYTASDKETDTLSTANTYNNYNLLSNNYHYTFVTNRIGLNYRFVEKKYNYTLGLGVQPATLDGQSLTNGAPPTHTTTFNVIPTARFIYNITRGKSLSFNYNGSSSQPSFNQLQPVTDFSNALYPVQGNPDLDPEFNNNISLRYNNFSFQTGDIFFSNLSFTQTNNKIVASTITYPSTFTAAALQANPSLKNYQNTNLTNYVNTNGYYTAAANITYAKPWDNRKYTLMFNGVASYTNNIGYSGSIDSNNVASPVLKNIAKSLAVTPGVRFRVNITDIIDAEANSTYGISKTSNSLNTPLYNSNNNIRTLTLGLNGKNYFWKDWTLSYDFTRTVNYGYDASLNIKSTNIFNTYVERRFLKDNRGTLRLAAFDLFNQNTGYSYVPNGNITTQSNVNRLGRYYLLTFTLRLQKFAGKAPAQPMRGDRPPGGNGPGGSPSNGGGQGGPPPAGGAGPGGPI